MKHVLPILVLLFILGACAQAPNTSQPAGTAVIGPAGGFVISADGSARADFPPGAFSSDTLVSISPATAQPPSQFGELIGLPYRFQPSGTFNAPVRIQMRLASQDLPRDDHPTLVMQDGATGEWGTLDSVIVNRADGIISGTTTHFSTIAQVRQSTAAAGTAQLPLLLPVSRSSYRVSQDFGEVLDVSPRHHPGLDIAATAGTPVRAVGAGWIALIQRDDNTFSRKLGNVVVLGHALPDGRRVYSLSAHLQNGSPAFEMLWNAATAAGCAIGRDYGPRGANANQVTCPDSRVPVSASQTIGHVGNTAGGDTVGNHLHFSLQTFPTLINYSATGEPVNPRVYTPGWPGDFGYLDPDHYFADVTLNVNRLSGVISGATPVTVIDGPANVRTGPGTHNTALQSLPTGTQLYAVAEARVSDSCPTWLQVIRVLDFRTTDGQPRENDGKAKYRDLYFSDAEGFIRDAWVCADLVASTTQPDPEEKPDPTPEPNDPPIIESFTAPSSALSGDRITVRWNVTDPDKDRIRCELDFDDGTDPISISDCQATTSRSYRFERPGTYALTLLASDGDATVSRTVTIQVRDSIPNQAPEIESFRANGSTHEAPAQVHFTWQVSDADRSDQLTCRITYGDGAAENAECAEGSANHRYATAGSYTARLVVTDRAGATDSATVNIRVTEPQETGTEPRVTGINPTRPLATMTPQDITITGTNFVRGAGVVLIEMSSGQPFDMAGKAQFLSDTTIVLRGVVFGTPAGEWRVFVRNYPGTSQAIDSNRYSFWTR